MRTLSCSLDGGGKLWLFLADHCGKVAGLWDWKVLRGDGVVNLVETERELIRTATADPIGCEHQVLSKG